MDVQKVMIVPEVEVLKTLTRISILDQTPQQKAQFLCQPLYPLVVLVELLMLCSSNGIFYSDVKKWSRANENVCFKCRFKFDHDRRKV